MTLARSRVELIVVAAHSDTPKNTIGMRGDRIQYFCNAKVSLRGRARTRAIEKNCQGTAKVCMKNLSRTYQSAPDPNKSLSRTPEYATARCQLVDSNVVEVAFTGRTYVSLGAFSKSAIKLEKIIRKCNNARQTY